MEDELIFFTKGKATSILGQNGSYSSSQLDLSLAQLSPSLSSHFSLFMNLLDGVLSMFK
jgi:hypothetical protein